MYSESSPTPCSRGESRKRTPSPSSTVARPVVKRQRRSEPASRPKRSTALVIPTDTTGMRMFPVCMIRSVTPYSPWERTLV